MEPAEENSGGVSIRTKFAINPFIDEVNIRLGKKRVSVARGENLVDREGEITGVTEICQVVTVDSEQFVKLYTANLKVFFDLKPAGFKVLQYVLKVVQENVGTDRVYLNQTDALEKVGDLSKSTFFRGFNELLEKKFIAASTLQNLYFINPILFFNGDRARFVTEYRREPVRAFKRRDDKTIDFINGSSDSEIT